jgi:hypothetical protein
VRLNFLKTNVGQLLSKMRCSRRVIVGHPRLAGPVRAGDHNPVQDGGEDGPLDRELEGAPGQEILDDRTTAGLLLQSPEP